MRRDLAAVVPALIVLLLARVSIGESAPRFPVVLTDDAGRRVTLSASPRRIVSLSPAHTETIYALGAGNRLVAADTYSDYPPEARSRAKLNCWPRPPLEAIVALKPDLVVVLTEDDEFLRQLDAVRIPGLKLFPHSYDSAFRAIETLGRALGVSDRAGRLTADLRTRTDRVRKRLQGVRRKRVLLEMDASDPARPYVAGGKGLYGEIMGMAGGENVFADVPQPAAQVSVEQIVSRDPEVILLGDSRAPRNPQQPERLRTRPGWSGIAAVRSGKVFAIASEPITRPGPRVAEGLEAVARLLHPERFR